MNLVTTQLSNRLSLRTPQKESLEILANIADLLELKNGANQKTELEKIVNKYGTVSDFERDFPSLCFALATGVGKTRLMGAFIAYLFLAKQIKNYFILAPNLTIYNKLIDDFSNQSSAKYVFKGISEFVHHQPLIITGDNYDELSQKGFFDSGVVINIFNISKINSETRAGKEPKIKRLSEYIGDSYFNYLSNLEDLVLLMDESHHYRAARGMKVINELNPILGLELTATPHTERKNKSIPFKNVIYDYSLAKAIQDGYVKIPAVATRKDFNPIGMSASEIDKIKVEDGIKIHRNTKTQLDLYSQDEQVEKVKPFALIVTKDTTHATNIKHIIQSDSFFDGYYKNKVIEVHSKQKGSEKDENIQQLVSLENPHNKIEIVIHVNMLKEGWDVNNLYTIIPLRTAASVTLREQTIGRGLRLPYGQRTGVKYVDTLTIVAHDKFQEIIDEANKPGSIIQKQNIIFIEGDEFEKDKEIIKSVSSIQKLFSIDKDQLTQTNVAKNLIYDAITNSKLDIDSIKDLKNKKTEISNQVKEKIVSDYHNLSINVQNLFDEVVQIVQENIIKIPHITLRQSSKIESGFHPFDLDGNQINFKPVSEEIIIKSLESKNSSTEILDLEKNRQDSDSVFLITQMLIAYPEIEYDRDSKLLNKLAKQMLNKLKTNLNNDDVVNVVIYHRKEIAKIIYNQMMSNFFSHSPEFEVPRVRPFTKIEEHHYAKFKDDKIFEFTMTVTPVNTIPSKIFQGFKKAAHQYYKFDSKSEKDFAIILENDSSVLKWLRPAKQQFKIYWNHNTQLYEPDFVVETKNSIFMIEVKQAGKEHDADVQDKAKSALEYCKAASMHTKKHNGKKWRYLLITHDEIKLNMSFDYFINKFELTNK